MTKRARFPSSPVMLIPNCHAELVSASVTITLSSPVMLNLFQHLLLILFIFLSDCLRELKVLKQVQDDYSGCPLGFLHPYHYCTALHNKKQIPIADGLGLAIYEKDYYFIIEAIFSWSFAAATAFV